MKIGNKIKVRREPKESKEREVRNQKRKAHFGSFEYRDVAVILYFLNLTIFVFGNVY